MPAEIKCTVSVNCEIGHMYLYSDRKLIEKGGRKNVLTNNKEKFCDGEVVGGALVMRQRQENNMIRISPNPWLVILENLWHTPGLLRHI